MASDRAGEPQEHRTRILIHVPTLRDAGVTQAVLTQAGLDSVVCKDMVTLVREADAGVDALLMTEEVLPDPGNHLLIKWLRNQPDWSDLPIILLVRGAVLSTGTSEAIRLLGNVTVLERPAALRTVASAMQAAVRSRLRQYQIRDQLQQLRAADEEKRALLDREQAARSDAERAGRMKDEFLATLSHELRTPLNAILGWTQILNGENREPALVDEGLKVIERNARVQTQIISDLLDMSRIISGKVRLEMRRINAAESLQSAVDAVMPSAAKKGIQIRMHIEMPDVPLDADPGRLQQVFWNLLTNSIKFTPKSGAIDVSLKCIEASVQISVADTGEGIRPEFLPFVFERFRQADSSTTRRHGGLGLGLSIVKQLVEMHGGRIHADSAGTGRGATFTVTLPTNAQHPFESTDHDCSANGESRKQFESCRDVNLHGVRVLVVDDEPDARKLLTLILEDCDAEVQTAQSARDGLLKLKQFTPDVIISDIGMPEQDGYEFLRSIRRAGIHIPAVALTAFARAEDHDRSIQAGYHSHLTKPVEPATLLSTLEQIVRGVKEPI